MENQAFDLRRFLFLQVESPENGVTIFFSTGE